MKARIAAPIDRLGIRRPHILFAAVLALALTFALGATLASAVAPSVTIEPASGVDGNQAHLKGHVVAEDANVFGCRFEYVTDAQYTDPGEGGFAQAEPNSQLVECSGALPEAGNEADVEADLSGLKPATLYHVRLHADNGEASNSSEEEFETDAVTAPAVTIDPPSSVDGVSAHLSGTVDPVDPGSQEDDAFDASCRFQYVTDAQFTEDGFAQAEPNGQKVGCDVNPVSGTEPVNVAADLSGLKPATVYHVRLLAANAGGAAEDTESFETEAVEAPTLTEPEVSAITARRAHFFATVDPNGYPTTARYQISKDGGSTWICFGQGQILNFCGLQYPTALGSGTEPVNFPDDVSGLQPATDYLVRLVATNPGGESVSGPVPFATEALAPTVGDNASAAGLTKATLAGWVNPHNYNSSTEYWFEWGSAGPCSANPCQSTPIQSLASGDEPVHVHAGLTGLSPNTTYHYRLIAQSDAGTAEGRDRSVVTSVGLPEGRAYELVSPPEKFGSDVFIDSGRTRVSVDGDAIQFASRGGFADVRGTGTATEYVARRSADAWTTHAITPFQRPQSLGNLAEKGLEPRYMGEFSDDLDSGVFLSNSLINAEGDNVGEVPNLYLRHDLLDPGPGSFQLLTDAPDPVSLFNLAYKPSYAGASADFTHVVFSSPLRLTPDAPPFEPPANRAYEWVQGQGLRFVGVLPESEGGGPATSSILGRNPGAPENYTPNVISRDGSRIFFTDQAPVPDLRKGRLYLRENGTTTIRINASERTDCAGDPTCGGDGEPDPAPGAEQPAEFWDASEDGLVAYFTTAEQLTNDDDDNSVDLYRWERNAPPNSRLTLISVDNEPGDSPNANPGVVGTSPDGSYVYFIGLSQLAPGGPPRPGSHTQLFAWHDGTVSFIGTATESDDFSLLAVSGWAQGYKHVRVTPDGRHLYFTSRANLQLTGYDNADNSVCPFDNGVGGCSEVYLYTADPDGGPGQLACASCRPDGARATSGAAPMQRVAEGGSAAGSVLPRALSADGRLAFFTSGDRLVPGDTNGNVSDVYAYDTQTGQVRLLSTGRASTPSYFLGASTSGEDVFFATRERLVSSDTDSAYDIYDARVGGGIPSQNLVPPAPPCEGDACQPPPNVPLDATAASAGLFGPGDPRPGRRPRCRRRARGAGERAKRSKRAKCPKGKRRHRADHNRRAAR